ncbi:hypothetical protein [Paenibacillus sp. Leaf72]|uniref:hypothetical protein n=1 Tax=Paenibacillus sp. Leaf72 TaxID=1736234 RepID=UPI0006FE33CE|nr:hypothetical protein [Paenibacillus sp. Leaf72]KQN96950.1 hypothetical protein ASF12_23050 [Paenibacillus sp. Leaf72]
MKKIVSVLMVTAISFACLVGCSENDVNSSVKMPEDLKEFQHGMAEDMGIDLSEISQEVEIAKQEIEQVITTVEKLTVVIETNRSVNSASQSNGAAKFALEKLMELSMNESSNINFLIERVDKIQYELDKINELKTEVEKQKTLAFKTIDEKKVEVLSSQRKYEQWKVMQEENNMKDAAFEERAEVAFKVAFEKIEKSTEDVRTAEAAVQKYLDETQSILIKAKNMIVVA